jgi:hypothetical protein
MSDVPDAQIKSGVERPPALAGIHPVVLAAAAGVFLASVPRLLLAVHGWDAANDVTAIHYGAEAIEPQDHIEQFGLAGSLLGLGCLVLLVVATLGSAALRRPLAAVVSAVAVAAQLVALVVGPFRWRGIPGPSLEQKVDDSYDVTGYEWSVALTAFVLTAAAALFVTIRQGRRQAGGA